MVPLLLLVLACCVLGVLHTYLFYPTHTIRAAARRCSDFPPITPPETRWPDVHLLMAVHNEEGVLPAKFQSLAQQDYPGTLHLHFGSDRSTDGTNALLTAFRDTSPFPTHVLLGQTRTGKPGMIDLLAGSITEPDAVFILTDANVLLAPNTVTELVRPLLTNAPIGVVDTRMIHTGTDRTTISQLEDRYITGEVALKRAESCLWETMIGPFGGCFAIRAAAYSPVPPTFLVDDFYLCMRAYERGYRAVSSATALAYEGVGQRLADEFRRKRRIGAGNWQNLVRFRKLWCPPWRNKLAYALFSHKILRWCTPHLLLLGATCWAAAVLLTGNYWGGALLLLLTAILCASWVLPPLCAPLGLPCTRVRALRYFMAMNVALLLGFFDYLTGIKTNVWQPSHRPQDDGPR